MNEFLNEFRETLKTCLQDEPPFCQVSCPFNFDIKDFITKMRGGFNAFRAYHNAVGFPGIVSTRVMNLVELPALEPKWMTALP